MVNPNSFYLFHFKYNTADSLFTLGCTTECRLFIFHRDSFRLHVLVYIRKKTSLLAGTEIV